MPMPPAWAALRPMRLPSAATRAVLFAWANTYLVLSLNFVGIFAHGLPEQTNIDRSESPFDSSSAQVLGRYPHNGHPQSYFLSKRASFSPSPVDGSSTSSSTRASSSAYAFSGDADSLDLSVEQKPVRFPSETGQPPIRGHLRPQASRRVAPLRRGDGRPRPQQQPQLQPHQQPRRPQVQAQGPRAPHRRPASAATGNKWLRNPQERLQTAANRPPQSFAETFSAQVRPPQPPPGPSPPHTSSGGLLGLIGLGAKEQAPPAYPQPYDQDPDDFAEYYDSEVVPFPRPSASISTRVFKWLDGFKPPLLQKGGGGGGQSPQKRPPDRIHTEAAPGTIDYSQFEIGEDHNLVLYNTSATNPSQGDFDFSDVFESLKKNETREETLRKLISAAAGLGERSSSSPVYMFWTLPTTLLAILGAFYFVSAIAILGYQYQLGGASGANNGLALIPTAVALTIPVVAAFIVVTMRSSINGKLSVKKIMRGDIRNSMGSDFDGVDFVLDGLFGSSALLGIGWLVSVAL